MKRMLFFLLCLIALLGLAAAVQAEPFIQAMPMEQVNAIVPDGLVLKNRTLANGSLTLVIDDDSTNWARAIAHTGTGAGDAQVLWQIKVPSGVQVGDYVIMVSGTDEADALSTLHYCEQYNDYKKIEKIDSWQVACRGDGMPHTERGVLVARSIPEMAYLNPQTVSETIYVGWYRQNSYDEMVLIDNTYQKLDVSFQHTRSSAFKTNVFNAVPSERIKANAEGNANVTVISQKDGAVNYCIPESGINVMTGVLAPDGAVSYSVLSNLKSGPAAASESLPADRYVLLGVSRGRQDANCGTQTVFFYDADGDVLDEVSINIGYQYAEQMLVWPAYNDQLNVVPESRVQIVNGAEKAGYSVAYDAESGHIKGSYTGKMGTNVPGMVEVKVAAPEGAVSCRIHVAGGNNVYGHEAGSLAGLEYELEESHPQGPVEIQEGYVHTESYEAFQKIQPKDDKITIYVPPMSAGIPNFVELYAFEWYDEWGDRIDTIEYLWQTIERFSVAETLIPVKQEKDLNSVVTQPEIVVPNGKPFEGYQLKMVAYYTEGTNTWLYDLTMLDADGNAAKPNTPVWVYLPFPEGHKTDTKYKLNHYTNGLYDESNTGKSETLLIQETLYGLMFETSSFSPFILSVQEPESTPSDVLTVNVKMEDFTAADITPELKQAEYLTINDIETALVAKLLSHGKGVRSTKLYEATLMYLSNGKWIEADETHFPMRDGEPWLHVLLDLPAGTTPAHQFWVAHMFATNSFGKKAEYVETPDVEVVYVNGVPKLSFYVTGLSPIMVGWTEPAANPVPQTGDATPLSLLMALMVFSAGAILLIIRRRRSA